MTAVYFISAVVLLAAGIIAIIRAERGPSLLDRTLALDVFATILVAGIAIEAAWSRRTDTLPILVALSMVGFVSSVAISRFASRESDDDRRILTPDEVAAEDARLRAEEEAMDDFTPVTMHEEEEL